MRSFYAGGETDVGNKLGIRTAQTHSSEVAMAEYQAVSNAERAGDSPGFVVTPWLDLEQDDLQPRPYHWAAL